MSKEFIEGKHNGRALDIAKRQQRQLSYLTTSQVQEDTRIDYFEKFADKKYFTNDIFLNWVKQVLKTKNFLSFAKYYRNPNASSKLVNNRIKETLSRVFFSEDSYFNYIINGEPIAHPKELEDKFEERLFDALIFNHNDIIVHDLYDTNKPYREFVGIDKVVSIEVKHNTILRLAYTACIDINGEKEYGYAYLDGEKYEFYSKDYDLLKSEPHDYGMCPATFVVEKSFYPEGDDHDPNGIVKKSIFSHVRDDMEFYNFLKVLQKITDTNSTFPITVRPKVKELTEDGFDTKDVENAPMGITQIGSQASIASRAEAGNNGGGITQAGTEITVPPVEKNDGSIDMELAKNFITFYHAPVDILKFIKERIQDLEDSILISTVGNYSDGNNVSLTEMQVSKNFVSMDDKLRSVSSSLSFSRQNSDLMMLSLAYGRENVKCDVFYGSDFFLETPEKLYDMFQKSPNIIERRNILTRLSQRRNMFNKQKQKREVILYKLLPYSSDIDFNIAVEGGYVDYKTFQLQSRFNYWISHFESLYGRIELFWDSINASDSEKITEINSLILNLIPDGKEVNSKIESVQRTET